MKSLKNLETEMLQKVDFEKYFFKKTKRKGVLVFTRDEDRWIFNLNADREEQKYGANRNRQRKLEAKKIPKLLEIIENDFRDFMNRDPDAYRYKWSTGSKNFQEHLEHFVSKQKSHFQVVFDRLRINQYSIDWSEVIDKKDLSKPLRFFLSNFGNIPIHRSEIYIYELKGPNDPQFLESIGDDKTSIVEKLLEMEKNKVLVGDRGRFVGSGWEWRWNWRRRPFGRELSELEDLCKWVENFKPVFGEKDKVVWLLNPVEGFSVKTLRSIIEERISRGRVGVGNGCYTKWLKVTPTKVNVFFWKANLERLPCRALLDKCGIDLDTVLCPRCNQEVETVQHALLSCEEKSNEDLCDRLVVFQRTIFEWVVQRCKHMRKEWRYWISDPMGTRRLTDFDRFPEGGPLSFKFSVDSPLEERNRSTFSGYAAITRSIFSSVIKHPLSTRTFVTSGSSKTSPNSSTSSSSTSPSSSKPVLSIRS
ncbi:hypothetical protein OSB04_011047 [Centaurea solstitialis]|uniref:Reverse transcriptase zinc-binding domain-containing protein n=1 Tax=Centaurea solstitialis TaxID=347529 RepID=A0AA38TTG2_9ASTR|nr:hypothetical protein OSB04_011047 [Centaurea solstitialis]